MLKGVILFGFKVDGCLAFEFEGVFLNSMTSLCNNSDITLKVKLMQSYCRKGVKLHQLLKMLYYFPLTKRIG